ncbi:hypothetical protein Tdes44962_MAKER06790 [Teratosphaeria destructans]|uniref:Uncharacterized protein n=1 Tax=Teratosphaeria destructans TaxID=418781 RepID=A0A9W7T0Q9_9PEZI|nr:hypothetical protein Tdes44962_MAKER06790 [Teratosphaeria destructans]
MGDERIQTEPSRDTLVETPERQANSSSASVEVKNESTVQTIELDTPPPPRGVSFCMRIDQFTSAAIRPFFGLLCLGVSICSVFFSAAILITSNNKPVDSWAIQPTVFLAIAAALSNTAVTVAYSQAVIIAWWYRASRGATILALEKQWEASTGLFSPLYHIKHPNLVVVATLLVWSMIADGPMLQRAASVVSATQWKMLPFNVTLTPELPTGFSGQRLYNDIVMSGAVIAICEDWTAQTPISLAVNPPCKGTCATTVRGPGVTKATCSTKTWPITYEMYHDPNATWGEWPMPVSLDPTAPTNPVFQVVLGPHKDGPSNPVPQEAAVTIIGSISIFNSSGKFEETKCYWVPAILEYDVVFGNDGHVRLLQDLDNPSSKVVALANNTHATPGWVEPPKQPATLDFLADYLGSFVKANASAVAPVPNAQAESSTVWHADATTYNSQAFKYHNFTWSAVEHTYIDPTPDIINSMNEMMFRSAVLASATQPNVSQLIDPGLSLEQNIMANQSVTHNVFHSDFAWFGAATALDLIVILAVLPLFWGFWKLEKHLSLSPCSLALAFNSPLLKEADPLKGAEGVVERYGSMKIKYGEVVDGEEGELVMSAENSRIAPAERVDSMASSRKAFARCRDRGRV